MQLKLPNRNLAITDAKNDSVMVLHFERVYTNHRLITWPALKDIEPHNIFEGINILISWEEIKFVVRKLANNKSLGLNNVPPDASRHPPTRTLTSYSTSSTHTGAKKFSEWNKEQVFLVPKKTSISPI